MKIAPVSADLLIKVGIGIAALVAGYFILKKAKEAVVSVAASVSDAPGHLWDTVRDYGARTAETVKVAIGADGLTYPKEWQFVDPERVWEEGPM